MYYRVNLSDVTQTLPVWNEAGTLRFTLSPTNTAQLISADTQSECKTRLVGLMYTSQVTVDELPQYGITKALNTIREPIAPASITGQVITLQHEPNSEEEVQFVLTDQTIIEPADFVAINLTAKTVEVAARIILTGDVVCVYTYELTA